MKKIKLMTIVGTRPEMIRLSEIIKKADIYFDHVFVHTGQNYDKNLKDVFFTDLDLREPDYYLSAVGKNPGAAIGNIIAKSYDVMLKEQPDALLILGDTNSALCAISAKRLKIPIFHMEAGNRCFDENLPEETNRRIIDHISDVNLPYTEHARRYLVLEGVCKEHIYVTGSPMREIIKVHEDKIAKSNVLKRLGIQEKKYFLLSAHREENIDNEEHFFCLMEAVNELSEVYGLPIIYSMHPRSAKFIQERQFRFHPLVKMMPPFNFSDYSALMKQAYCVISDSGTMPEESAIEHFPAVCIRTSTERPESLETGCYILGGIMKKSILQSVEIAVGLAEEGDFGTEVRNYTSDKVSSTIIRLIQSYVPIVNDKIWRKNG
ncbi:non-hydrolyzing UDP-N-acetylglucosamine 2-epimerase [Pectinatus frisingensis]|uniref:non-hydrolyzing UDP-N-acetylglucosamine 2-epimerase n=1 Tax=Pectinatus frisingensis TaxID=865 RepID=UPI0018C7E4D8|nr:UDP-N-acetylglucosamine 2-epimerase (non-hydrolyzing) [Pectinatus frisingensis]